MEFAEVVLNIPVRKGFHYSIPDGLRGRVVPGARVTVPFGPRREEGTCVRLMATAAAEGVRPVEGVVEEIPAVPDELLDLTRWVADRYLSSWGQALSCAMPTGIHRGRKPRPVLMVRLLRPNDELEIPGGSASASRLKVSRKKLERLASEGVIALEKVEPDVELPEADLFSETAPERLTADQERALGRIDTSRHGVYLLDGVTASGKTEVYIRTALKVLAEGRQVLFLLPEISLTAQMLGRLRSRLGPVALMHSRMSPGSRARQWREALAGRVGVVLGARSAVFTPAARLGLIVVDEEHDSSYKEHSAPRYHAREVAIERGRRAGVAVILGSATPSVESMWRARQGEFEHLRMPTRVGGRSLPSVQIISMALEKRPASITRVLREAILETLKQGRQVILYLNRRGFATSVRCRRCGWLLRCDRCEVVLAYHRALGGALCHYCMKSAPMPATCPDCRGSAPAPSGAGTERVEDELRSLTPGTTILRMDTDAMKTRRAFREALAAFRDGRAQVLVGTKMIAKGFHFPNVTLVGVINADTAFHLPDFRNTETTYQELTHVTGRPGRGEHPGRVLVQTYHPTHYSVECAARHDAARFYEEELASRRACAYPPFGSLVRVLMEGRDELLTRKSAAQFAGGLREFGVDVLGPTPAPIYRIRNRYRYHLLGKHPDGAKLREIVAWLMDRRAVRGTVDLTVDVDPYDAK